MVSKKPFEAKSYGVIFTGCVTFIAKEPFNTGQRYHKL